MEIKKGVYKEIFFGDSYILRFVEYRWKLFKFGDDIFIKLLRKFNNVIYNVEWWIFVWFLFEKYMSYM